MRFRFADHLGDVVFGQTTRGRDRDLLLFPGSQIFGGDVDDAVRIDVESHLNLRNSTRSRRNADQVELAERSVVSRHGPLALQNVNLDGSLTVRRGGENFALSRRNRGVALDQLSENAAQRLD